MAPWRRRLAYGGKVCLAAFGRGRRGPRRGNAHRRLAGWTGIPRGILERRVWTARGHCGRCPLRCGIAPPVVAGQARGGAVQLVDAAVQALSLIHISEPTRLLSISYAVF